MPVTKIIHFDVKLSLDAHAPCTTVDDTIRDAVKALKGVEIPQHFVLGT